MTSGVAPNLAERWAQLKTDYAGAKATRFSRNRIGLAPGGSGADYHIRSEYQYLREMEVARDMDRNDSIVPAMMNRLTTNVIQDGFRLDPQTDDPALNRELSNRWNDWAGDATACDHGRRLTFADMQRLVLRQTYVDGDHLVLPLRDGSLQLVEAHRLITPVLQTQQNIVLGVKMDRERRPVGYWMYSEEVLPSRALESRRKFHYYPAFDDAGRPAVLHVMDPQRVSQTRGVTVFNPIMDDLGMAEDISFAKLVQAQTVSCFGVLHSLKDDFGTGDAAAHGERETQTLADGSTRTLEGMSPGLEWFGRPGEDLKGFSPNVPNPEFFPHMKLLLGIAGAHLGLPLVILLLDASETNFSGFRGAVDQARMEFRRVQGWLIRRFHRPVYEFKVRQWAQESPQLQARLQRGDPILKHVWSAPSWPYIEPFKDAQADSLRLKDGLISPRRFHAERGRDYEDVARERVEDNVLLIRQAIEAANGLNQEFPDAGVRWRELIGFAESGTPPAEAAREPDDNRDEDSDQEENR